jgi:hypothetical protein
MANATREEKFERQFLRHERCGGEYQVFGAGEIVAEAADCPICGEIRERYLTSHGLNNTATAGTPLAGELGLVVLLDKIGPVAS